VNHKNRGAFRNRGEDVECIVIAIQETWYSSEKTCGNSPAFLWRERAMRRSPEMRAIADD
jgi:hypothetical protein